MLSLSRCRAVWADFNVVAIARAGVVWTTIAAALLLPTGPADAFSIESSAGGYSVWYAPDPGGLLEEDEGSDVTNTANVTAAGKAYIDCRSELGCVIGDPGDPTHWKYQATGVGNARTDYGTNRARAYASTYDENPGGFPGAEDSAYATSHWEDEITLISFPGVSGPLEFTFRLDGSWSNFGEMNFAFGIYDPTAYLGAETGLAYPYEGSFGEITNNRFGSCGVGVGVCTVVSNANNPSGSFDETMTLSVDWAPNRIYNIFATLSVGANTGSAGLSSVEIDAFTTGLLQSILIPEGGSLVSAAGALGNYNVGVVPEPGTGTMLGLGLMCLSGMRGRAGRGRAR